MKSATMRAGKPAASNHNPRDWLDKGIADMGEGVEMQVEKSRRGHMGGSSRNRKSKEINRKSKEGRWPSP
ncbi:MAG: hypothetical protein L0Y78_01065 [candidate division NC10 bacterium]|nr:hypothetical protein [candidate division NC10 bacterium]